MALPRQRLICLTGGKNIGILPNSRSKVALGETLNLGDLTTQDLHYPRAALGVHLHILELQRKR